MYKLSCFTGNVKMKTYLFKSPAKAVEVGQNWRKLSSKNTYTYEYLDIENVVILDEKDRRYEA